MSSTSIPDAPTGRRPVPALPCICLAGPTASGKTAASLAIVQALRGVRPVEIISVDSALVYRGMDIGTAKPTAAERAQAPHHLIDIIEPFESYSAARFANDARALIAEIVARGHLPLLVGGTMLYFKALFEGLDAMPGADAGVRLALERIVQREGLAALYRELQQVDPVTAARLQPNDAQRIQRALEVYRVSGQALSSLHTSKAKEPTPALISLEPIDRSWLHQRIALRFRQMLDAGLVDEVRALRARGDLHADLPAMRCVGYRQAWQALDEGGLSHLPERGIAATRQLAKRQLTWLRSMPQRMVVACDRADASEQVVALALAAAAQLGVAGPT
jgi:tRNA dimethylallyltransferase